MHRRYSWFVLAFALGCGSSTNDPGTDGGEPPDLTRPAADAAAPDAASPDAASPLLDGDVPDVAAPADLAPAPDLAPALDPAVYHDRANQALESLLLHYWSQSLGYLSQQPQPSGDRTGYWTFAQAYDAVLDGVERSGGARYAGWVEGLYQAAESHGWGWKVDYYDDESWMTIALLRAYDLTGNAKYLDQAKDLYADIMSAWDETCCGANKGGIWWNHDHTQKATASNVGPVIAGARLATRTGDASYRAFAEKVYAYWRTYMTDPSTFEAFDHIEAATGEIVKWKFTYNEGLWIGAAVELGKLDDARGFAGRMLAAETTTTSYGTVLFDGTNAGCAGDCAQFKGIGYRYLALLQGKDPHAEYAAALRASAESIWSLARGSSGLFAIDWAGPAPTGAAGIEAQSSAAMALARFAASVGPEAPPAGIVLEAEEGTLHALGLEASHAGHSGWAYLAGWSSDGQWVDFTLRPPSAGTWKLSLRYAAGAGDAKRYLYLNGSGLVTAQVFPSTGSWDSWGTVTITVNLPAGASTFSVIYNSGNGSASYLNLDRVDLTQ